jgi:hypothetical protein
MCSLTPANNALMVPLTARSLPAHLPAVHSHVGKLAVLALLQLESQAYKRPSRTADKERQTAALVGSAGRRWRPPTARLKAPLAKTKCNTVHDVFPKKRLACCDMKLNMLHQLE